jgi:hypothetical protein
MLCYIDLKRATAFVSTKIIFVLTNAEQHFAMSFSQVTYCLSVAFYPSKCHSVHYHFSECRGAKSFLFFRIEILTGRGGQSNRDKPFKPFLSLIWLSGNKLMRFCS